MAEGTASDVKGRCLCGAVTVMLSSAKPQVDVCHCTMCRRWSGGPFLGVSGERHQVGGEDALTVFRSSDWAERAFCARCGSNIYFRFVPGDHYSFTAGLFDGAGGFRMKEQIFIDEKPDYYGFAEETPKLTGKQVAEKYGIGG